MANQNPNEDLYAEDPLEQLLDQESDEEFGLPEFKDHFADSLTPAVLKDWTAKDFASIYVRFRPHLERHAKRFLVNPSQVEEVVQDAFLYLMTTLPELDSELGVLKFLKWKVRLLCLDVIRANSRASFAPIDEQPEFAAKLPEMSEGLEHADDAAIVSLALAKLQPRQREALIATLYEEKSTEVVAAQMGLTENAFRQLLFRSRASFKKALVGEAETQGKSISQILSIAARKAAAESGKYISAAGAFLLVLAIAIGVVPNLSGQTQQIIAASEPTPVAEQPVEPAAPAEEPAAIESTEVAEEVVTEVAAEETEVFVAQVASVVSAPAAEATEVSKVDPNIQAMQTQLGRLAVKTLSSASQTQASSQQIAPSGTLTLTNDKGLSANVAYDLGTEAGIQFTWFSITVRGNTFAAVPKVDFAEKKVDESGITTLSYISTDLLIGDTEGKFGYLAIEDSQVSRSGVQIVIKVDPQGNLISSSLNLTPRS
ncbi:sigma-70 family RNA polymerase sigma factor [Aquiluna borgnonia]|uniref:Sigma-70 family RNA polymerase sigma factor n=1 Tax=Aquiluna borgnonia TaxID=2499157 RepID=A0A7D4TJN5_9MICO|nr:sigma-70 family RNA polymerase sigma factor [Aquiluna borgnonia]QKJ24752.1 sigma-70 family RNA polymerase sigma factor [Aquiluna borgnonia]